MISFGSWKWVNGDTGDLSGAGWGGLCEKGGEGGEPLFSPYAMIVPRVVFFVVSHPRVHVSAAGMLADEWEGPGFD